MYDLANKEIFYPFYHLLFKILFLRPCLNGTFSVLRACHRVEIKPYKTQRFPDLYFVNFPSGHRSKFCNLFIPLFILYLLLRPLWCLVSLIVVCFFFVTFKFSRPLYFASQRYVKYTLFRFIASLLRSAHRL